MTLAGHGGLAWLGALVLIAVACATPAPSPRAVATEPTLALAPCQVRSGVEARCGTLEVFEDRATRAGRTIPIKVADAPVLMLSGELDAATPAHYATTLARTLPNARQILIRNAAHEYFADCLRNLVADFFARGSARDLDTRCVETLRRPPFATP